ncbi:MAG TPA: sigma-70 family RNA polymerase sigma factor [Pyrinomonadaceae bacterium]|jgi:RNA polymerase sigma-70 factor (ECF subfamily)
MPENEMTGNLFLFARSEPNASAMTPQPETIKPESRLVDRIASGDEEAFGELYKMFAPLVHGITLARVPRDEVDDIVQEVFISAYKNIDTLRDKNAVGGWLAMIARNRAVEFYRRAKPTEELSEEMSGGKSQRAEANEILATIRALPETYRETLVLRLVEGMTGAEIAERTGMTPESVRVNLHRGMKLLRERLGIEVKR